MSPPVESVLSMARDAWGYIEAARASPLTILLVGAAALYLAWLLPRARCLWLMSKIHAPARGAWLIGNVADFKGLPKIRYAGRPDSQPLFTRLAAAALAEGHGLFRLSFFRFVPFLSREWVFVADIGLARELLSQGRYGAFQKGNFYQLAAPLIGSGMLAAPDGPDWKQTRRMATPGFHPSMLRLAVTGAAETTRKMCARWERTIGAARGLTFLWLRNVSRTELHQWPMALSPLPRL